MFDTTGETGLELPKVSKEFQAISSCFFIKDISKK